MNRAIFVLIGALVLSPAWPGRAATGPAPPQGAGTPDSRGEAGATVDPGQTLFVDPAGWGFCRTVQASGGAPGEQYIPLARPAEWLSWRISPPPTVGVTACCRPQAVTLCGGATVQTLAYTAEGGERLVSASCASPGGPWTDQQRWRCGSSGAGATADGAWTLAGESGAPPPAGCAAQTVWWQDDTYPNGMWCSGAVPAMPDGGGVSVFATASSPPGVWPGQGAAFQCQGTRWVDIGAGSSDTCRGDCAAAAVTWGQGCSGTAPATPAARYASVPNRTPGLAGAGSFWCDYGGWNNGGGSCYGCMPTWSYGPCSAACGGGSQTVTDVSGCQPAYSQSCNTQACAGGGGGGSWTEVGAGSCDPGKCPSGQDCGGDPATCPGPYGNPPGTWSFWGEAGWGGCAGGSTAISAGPYAFQCWALQ